MIVVDVQKKNDIVSNITISGHAKYSEHGTDIVCASVSSIVITTINALVRFKSDIKYEEKDGFISIDINQHEECVDILITNMIELLCELEKQYEKYIKIK